MREFGSQDVDCASVLATAAEWREVRSTMADVAARAAFAGYASDRFGPWEMSAQRRSLGAWPPGDAQLILTLAHRQDLVRQWLSELPMAGTPS